VTDLRPVREPDIPACLDVFYSALDELHARLQQAPIPRNPEALTRVFRHLIHTDPRSTWVADERGRIIGFGMAHQRGNHWYLGFLFVRPDRQGRGVGRAILERCLPEESERGRTRLSVCIEAIQPVSTALYAQYGMLPRLPVYVLIGEVRTGSLPDPARGLAAAGLEAVPFGSLDDPALVSFELDALDRPVVGYARPQEHQFLAVPDRKGFLYREGPRVAAYGYVQPSGRIGPVCATEPSMLAPILGHLVQAVKPVGAWQAIVPGPAGDALLPLMRAGLRIDEPPVLYCSSWDGPRFDRYLPINFALN
jgi:GNAT superfamily N-acetyltransferase